MLRYFISFPPGVDIRPEQLRYLREFLEEVANDRQFRDLVVNMGATITDMRRKNPTPAFIRRARSRAR